MHTRIDKSFRVFYRDIKIYVMKTGLIWSEIKQLWDVGLQEYVGDMWNVLDFVTNSLYVATIALRIVAHYQVSPYFSYSEITGITFIISRRWLQVF